MVPQKINVIKQLLKQTDWKEIMELRIYVSREQAQKALENANIKQNATRSNSENPWKYGWGPFEPDQDNPEQAYYTINSLVVEHPTITKDLEVKSITLHAKLAAEQNQHIKQGTGTVGKTQWEVEFGAESFRPQSDSSDSYFLKSFRAIISIWVRGENVQSVIDCYKKIRQGDLGGNWKGEPAAIIATTNMDEFIE